MQFQFSPALSGLALLAASACGSGPADAPVPTRITFTAAAVALAHGTIGQPIPLGASVSGVDATRALHWTSRNPAVVAIDSTQAGGSVAWVHAVSTGQTFLILTVTGRSGASDSLSVSVAAFP